MCSASQLSISDIGLERAAEALQRRRDGLVLARDLKGQRIEPVALRILRCRRELLVDDREELLPQRLDLVCSALCQLAFVRPLKVEVDKRLPVVGQLEDVIARVGLRHLKEQTKETVSLGRGTREEKEKRGKQEGGVVG